MKQENIIQGAGKRQLKIQSKHITRAYRRYIVFPEIRLSGRWLFDMGFRCGESVTVLHEKNKIIITANDEIEKVSKK